MIPVCCSYGGDFGVVEGGVVYLGEKKKIMHVHPAIDYQAPLSELTAFLSSSSSSVGLDVKYRYPGFKLDGYTLISICNDEDVGNMIMSFANCGSDHPLEVYMIFSSAGPLESRSTIRAKINTRWVQLISLLMLCNYIYLLSSPPFFTFLVNFLINKLQATR